MMGHLLHTRHCPSCANVENCTGHDQGRAMRCNRCGLRYTLPNNPALQYTYAQLHNALHRVDTLTRQLQQHQPRLSLPGVSQPCQRCPQLQQEAAQQRTVHDQQLKATTHRAEAHVAAAISQRDKLHTDVQMLEVALAAQADGHTNELAKLTNDKAKLCSTLARLRQQHEDNSGALTAQHETAMAQAAAQQETAMAQAAAQQETAMAQAAAQQEAAMAQASAQQETAMAQASAQQEAALLTLRNEIAWLRARQSSNVPAQPDTESTETVAATPVSSPRGSPANKRKKKKKKKKKKKQGVSCEEGKEVDDDEAVLAEAAEYNVALQRHHVTELKEKAAAATKAMRAGEKLLRVTEAARDRAEGLHRQAAGYLMQAANVLGMQSLTATAPAGHVLSVLREHIRSYSETVGLYEHFIQKLIGAGSGLHAQEDPQFTNMPRLLLFNARVMIQKLQLYVREHDAMRRLLQTTTIVYCPARRDLLATLVAKAVGLTSGFLCTVTDSLALLKPTQMRLRIAAVRTAWAQCGVPDIVFGSPEHAKGILETVHRYLALPVSSISELTQHISRIAKWSPEGHRRQVTLMNGHLRLIFENMLLGLSKTKARLLGMLLYSTMLHASTQHSTIGGLMRHLAHKPVDEWLGADFVFKGCRISLGILQESVTQDPYGTRKELYLRQLATAAAASKAETEAAKYHSRDGPETRSAPSTCGKGTGTGTGTNCADGCLTCRRRIGKAAASTSDGGTRKTAADHVRRLLAMDVLNKTGALDETEAEAGAKAKTSLAPALSDDGAMPLPRHEQPISPPTPQVVLSTLDTVDVSIPPSILPNDRNLEEDLHTIRMHAAPNRTCVPWLRGMCVEPIFPETVKQVKAVVALIDQDISKAIARIQAQRADYVASWQSVVTKNKRKITTVTDDGSSDGSSSDGSSSNDASNDASNAEAK
jgi:chemotaxis protein histidine kinase CheA